MHDVELEATPPEHLRAGVRVSAVSIVWTVGSSAAAIVLGLAADSIVLVAFGLTGVLDALGSATLVVHFRHALRHEAFSDRHERIALRTVTRARSDPVADSHPSARRALLGMRPAICCLR